MPPDRFIATDTLDKNHLRQALISLRQGIALDVRSRWDQAIANQLNALPILHLASVIGVYWPIRNEPDLRALYTAWAANGKQLALPVVIDKNMPLKFFAWTPGDDLLKDAMGVWIPGGTLTEVHPEVVLVPCVGFNDARMRLGYGGGFYDRTLARSPRPQAIGVAYRCLRAAFATEAHDVAMDAIITEA